MRGCGKRLQGKMEACGVIRSVPKKIPSSGQLCRRNPPQASHRTDGAIVPCDVSELKSGSDGRGAFGDRDGSHGDEVPSPYPRRPSDTGIMGTNAFRVPVVEPRGECRGQFRRPSRNSSGMGYRCSSRVQRRSGTLPPPLPGRRHACSLWLGALGRQHRDPVARRSRRVRTRSTAARLARRAIHCSPSPPRRRSCATQCSPRRSDD